MASSTLICDTHPWKELKVHVEDIKKTHLHDLLSDDERSGSMTVEFDGILLDYSRQQATLQTKVKLFKLAEVASLKQKINRMYNGEHINSTDNRSVLHVAPRVGATEKKLKDVVAVGIGGSFLVPLFVHTAL